jgi:glycosyltransferase involved in cell wall biosynthesis
VIARPRVAIVYHTYLVGANRAKFQHLAAHADLTLVVPLQWSDTLRVMPLDPLAPDARYKLVALPSLFDGRLARFFFSPRAFWHTVRRLAPDLVHVETELTSLSLAQTALLKRWSLCFFTWQNIHRASTPIEAFSLAHADAAIAGNRAAADVLRAKGFHRPVTLCPQLGVDEPALTAPAPGHDGLRIGYVGRLVPEKGLLVLFEALKQLAGDWVLRLIGAGQLRASLEHLGVALGMAARVHFTGSLPHSDVAAHMRDLDVLVLPSLTTPRWKEQFGHVLIEAMALGVPVVGSDSGAIPEVIGEAGLIVPENDPKALCAALAQLLRDKSLRAHLAKLGFGRVRAEFTHERIACKTWDAWQPIL